MAHQLVDSVGKMKLGTISGGPSAPPLLLKTPKGTKDWLPDEMRLREEMFKTIVNIFKKHGGQTIDTPVFELMPILQGKYGEDSKLIFELKDQGGELTALRYDLTVPFARFLAQHPEYTSLKRYQIAKVYRRDQPAMNKGRMREFYQCDFDIAGTYDPMIPDAECLKILVETLNALKIDRYLIKVNHRKILDGIFEVCGVPLDKIRTISSAVDKLDKLPWEDVKKEMVEEKGLDQSIADEIGLYVNFKGGPELLEKLKADEKLANNASAQKGVEEMTLLFRYAEIFGITQYLSLDMSLARGLDYYTGLVYEAVTEGSAPKEKTSKKKEVTQEEYEESVGIGSISAGGRYDNLVGMFSTSKKVGSTSGGIPCVGLSIGVERVFSILWQKQAAESLRRNETDVYIISLGGNGLLDERLKIANECWQAGISAEFTYKLKPRLPAQFATTQKEKIPLAIIIGQQEVTQGMVKIKELGRQEEGYDGEQVTRGDMIQYIRQWSDRNLQRSM